MDSTKRHSSHILPRSGGAEPDLSRAKSTSSECLGRWGNKSVTQLIKQEEKVTERFFIIYFCLYINVRASKYCFRWLRLTHAAVKLFLAFGLFRMIKSNGTRLQTFLFLFTNCVSFNNWPAAKTIAPYTRRGRVSEITSNIPMNGERMDPILAQAEHTLRAVVRRAVG